MCKSLVFTGASNSFVGSKEPLSRTRHFSAPASCGDLVKGPTVQIKSELQFRLLSVKKSTSWLRRKCCFMQQKSQVDSTKMSSREEGDQPLNGLHFPSLADLVSRPVRAQTTCHSLLHRSEEKMRPSPLQNFNSTSNVFEPVCEQSEDPVLNFDLNLSVNPLILANFWYRRHLDPASPPHRWPSETRHDPGGGDRGCEKQTLNMPPTVRKNQCCYNSSGRKGRNFFNFRPENFFLMIFSFTFLLSILAGSVDAKEAKRKIDFQFLNRFIVV